MKFVISGRNEDYIEAKLIEADSLEDFITGVAAMKLGRFELVPPGGMAAGGRNDTQLWMLYFHNDYD